MPAHADPANFPDRLAGSVSLFGVSAATDRNGPSAGSGVNQALEITEIVDALHLAGDDLTKLDVQFVSSNSAGEQSSFAVRRRIAPRKLQLVGSVIGRSRSLPTAL